MARRTRGKMFHFYVNQCVNVECREVTYISLRPHNQTLCARCSKVAEANRKSAPKAQSKEIDMQVPE